jgi:hypothetical protein
MVDPVQATARQPWATSTPSIISRHPMPSIPVSLYNSSDSVFHFEYSIEKLKNGVSSIK